MPITNPLLNKANEQVSDPFAYTGSVVSNIFTIFFVVAVLYFSWFIFMAAFHLIDSQGDSKNIENSKKEFQYGFMGLAVIFSVFAIIKFVGFVLGVKGLKTLQLTLPTL
jgi:hypothetical protein